MRKHKTPKLIPVDLSRGKDSDHPDIKKGKKYLANIGGEQYLGTFSREWYGWNFNDGWGGSGHQFDTPGTNSSKWKALWEIR